MSGKPSDDFDAVRLIVEALKPFDGKDQERILRWAREKVGLQSAEIRATPLIPPISTAAAGDPSRASEVGRPRDIKSFAELKRPQSDNQFATVVAYYYQFEGSETERKPSITADDLQDATRKVGRERIKNPGQTLINAHGRGYFDKAERGSYKLTTVGENLVAMALPQEGPARRALSRKAKIRRKKT